MGVAQAAPYAELPVLTSENGVLDILMIAKPGTIDAFTEPRNRPVGWFYEVCQRPSKSDACPEGGATHHRYGGFRLQLQPGDELKIRLINHLPALYPETLTRIHDNPLLALNPTDLHTHGLIVPATANRSAPPAIPIYGDFVYTALFNYRGGDPEADPALYNPRAYSAMHAHFDMVYNDLSAMDYRIKIPANHPPGEYWIHPHVHGISHNQISAGMSGLISIGKAADYLCYDEACSVPAPETHVRHMILKDMRVLEGGLMQIEADPAFCQHSKPGDGVCDGAPGAYPGGHWYFTVNGQQFPAIPVSAEGDVWRFTNASASASYALQLIDDATGKKTPFQVLSINGAAFHYPQGPSETGAAEDLSRRISKVDCPEAKSTYQRTPICADEIVMMPSTRVEIAVANPGGGTATLRTHGINTGPGGDPWPEVNLASVAYAAAASTAHESMHVVGRLTDDLFAAGGALNPVAKAPIAAVTSSVDCAPLPIGHRRRLYFGNPNVANAAAGPGSDAWGNAIFGIGYEEVDEIGDVVPGTFRPMKEFDPSRIICVPLGPGGTPVVETWELINIATELHNFHIHQGRFVVVSEGQAKAAATMQTIATGIPEDSTPLPYAEPGPGSQPALNPGATSCLIADYKAGRCKATSVFVEIPFTELGEFVFHCHILEHEDGGMMYAIRVVRAKG